MDLSPLLSGDALCRIGVLCFGVMGDDLLVLDLLSPGDFACFVFGLSSSIMVRAGSNGSVRKDTGFAVEAAWLEIMPLLLLRES